MVELSNDQRQALDSAGTPLEVVDPRTGALYVLIDQSSFRRIQGLVSDELSDTYDAQIESAMQAGWSDPAMDKYNDYDQHRGA